MSKLGTILLSLVMAGVVGAVVWRYQVKKSADEQLKKGQAARVKAAPIVLLAKAAPKTLDETIEVVGSVESPFNVKISPKVSGRIEYLQAREGTPVKTGEVLVRIDPGDLRAAVLQQQSAVAEARSRLAQARATQGTTDVNVSTGIENQRAALSSADADLNQVSTNYAAQVATAQSQVVDADARVRAANAQVQSAQADLTSAEANFENAKTRYERVLSLYKDGYTAAQDVDDARTTMNVQQGAVGAARSKLASAKTAVESAQAQLNSARNTVSIVTKKGQADIEAAKAKSRQAVSGLKLANSNRTQTSAYRENIAALAAAVSVAEAQLAQARARVNDTTLVSPIDGTVTARLLDEGSLASAGQPVLNVQFLKWMYVTANVPIEQGQSVKIGTPVTINFDSLPGERVSGQIAEINPAADPQSRQFTVRIKLDNPVGRFRAGMFAHLSILLRRTQAEVTVPRDAVKTKEGVASVLVVDKDMVAHVTPVKTGANSPNEIQITEGVQPGDQVVTLSYQPVKDGQTVSVGAPKEGKGGAKAKRGGEKK